MHGKRLRRSPTFVTSNAEMHSASLPINSVAMLGRDLVQREANESLSLQVRATFTRWATTIVSCQRFQERNNWLLPNASRR